MRRQHRHGPSGPAAYWAAMQLLTRRNGSFTTHDVAERFEETATNTVRCYVRACFRADHVSEVGEEAPSHPMGRPRKLYAVNLNAPAKAPFEKPDRAALQGAAHQQMWTTMRGLLRFTSRELAATASTDDVAITADTARIFCWKLEQAGYLQLLGKDGRWKVLRLLPGMNTGPDVPVITGDGQVIDRNPRAKRRAS